MSEDLNELLIRACRKAATEQPSRVLDDNVLRAARMHLLWQRRRRYLVPLVAAAALGGLVVASNQRTREAHDEVRKIDASIANPVTAELLKMQPHVATSSAITDYLLNPNSRPASGDDAGDGADPTGG